MALNIPGVVAVLFFYIIILATGMWAARKARVAERNSKGDRLEVVLLGGRNIGLLVGIFTMTGKLISGTQKLILAKLTAGKTIINCYILPNIFCEIR